MKCLLFDNYDSFTYNLRHMLLELGLEVDVRRNDRIALDEVAAYDRIVLSPGPGIPSEAGLLPLIRRYAASKPILGICLGMQMAVVEYARHVCGWADAHSSELDPATTHPVIDSVTENYGAEAAGLLPGDVILCADGVPVYTNDDLLSARRTHIAGETIVLTVQRDGDVFDAEVVLYPVEG